MFSEPLLAHPAEIGGVHATWHPHPGDDADRDQHDSDADDEQHMVLAGFRSAYNDPHTRQGDCLCASAHGIRNTLTVSGALTYLKVESERAGDAARPAIVHVSSHSRQRHKVVTVMVLAIVSTRLP